MNEDEARRVARMLSEMDRPGVAAPADPDNPAGEWRIYDRPEPELREDITANVLDALIDRGDYSATLPAGGRPVRGFVIPPKNHAA
ncbi:hypothetical protein ACNYS0_20300 [Streptomyces sp. BH034]|uniref:hypothetical protein n=1 Tax=Streptomyces sp. BH034 TaxID=3402626 RepID=UPI003BB602E7